MINCDAKKDTQDYFSNINNTTVVVIDQLTMEAILTRDQRTTSHRVIDPRYAERINASSSRMGTTRRFENFDKTSKVSSGGPLSASTTNVGPGARCSSPHLQNSSSKRIRGYVGCRGSIVTCLRLGSLLVTLLVASINGAPTMTSEDRRLNSQRKWVNPCGLPTMNMESELDIIQLTDDQLLNQIEIQAKIALVYVEVFRDDWIKKTFYTDFADLHSDWKDDHYSWLPSTNEIPKELGGKLPNEFLEKLELDKALLDAYEYMQKYAVGLEQIVWDLQDHKNEFHAKFATTQLQLLMVLCEVQTAIVERGVTPRADVERSVMLPEYRDIGKSDETSLNLRDWMIFRDYMNGLEYVIQVFGYLRKRLDS